MNRSRIFIAFNVLQMVVLVVLCLTSAHLRAQRARHQWPLQQELVRQLQLTDFAVWTEARYTRHPSQADRFAAFQDLPSSLEHFPAGSVVMPPPTVLDLPPARR